MATDHVQVDLEDRSSCAAAVSWWEEKTASGSEGMVVKPLDFIAQGKKGLLQPAIKSRGVEYLAPHLRTRVHHCRQLAAPEAAQPANKAYVGPERVRPGPRRLGALREE